MAEKKKMGRPRRKIDLKLVEDLARIQCTISEISAILKIPESTLKNRKDFTTTFKNGKEDGKSSLRRYQWRMAEKNPGMAIWLGKQYLGQRETNLDDPNRPITVDFKFSVVKDEDSS